MLIIGKTRPALSGSRVGGGSRVGAGGRVGAGSRVGAGRRVVTGGRVGAGSRVGAESRVGVTAQWRRLSFCAIATDNVPLEFFSFFEPSSAQH